MRRTGRAAVVASVAVELPNHHRFFRIPKGAQRGEALGCWLAATLYSRGGELDGWCPVEALEPVSTAETRLRLVAVGLFEPEDRDGVLGFVVCKYAEFNETKSAIDARLAADRGRKTRLIRSESDRNPVGIRSESEKIPGFFPGNGNGNGNGNGSDPGVQRGPLATESAPAESDPLLAPGEAQSSACVARVATVELAVGKTPPISAEWLKFVGHYAGKLRRSEAPGKWQQWLVRAIELQKRADQQDRDRASRPGYRPEGPAPARPPPNLTRQRLAALDAERDAAVPPPTGLLDALAGPPPDRNPPKADGALLGQPHASATH
jgi:hypothetical protein